MRTLSYAISLAKQTTYVLYNVTLRSIRVTIVTVENTVIITYSECMFLVLGYPACKRPYCILICGMSVSLYRIFPHYLINGTTFGKKVIEHKMCDLYFCTVHVVTSTLFKTNSCTYFKTHFHIDIY
jgi:hypothetical protein